MNSGSLRAALATALASLCSHLHATEAPSHAPPPEMIGHWSFDADAESSVGGWTGTLEGGAEIGVDGAATGTGRYRNESGEGFLQTDLVGMRANERQTISVWFKTLADDSAEHALFGWGLEGINDSHDVGLKDGELHFQLRFNSATMELPIPVNDGNWHHLVISRQASALDRSTVYLNGKSIGSPEETFGGGGQGTIRIGTGFQRQSVNGDPPDRDFDGSLDDFAYFDTDLTAADAALIHGLAKLTGASVAEIQPARFLMEAPAGAVAAVGGGLWSAAEDLPGVTGDYGGTLEAGDAWIALDADGSGIRLLPDEPPSTANPVAIESLPATVTVRSGERATFPFELRNTGDEPVAWQADVVDEDGNGSTLEAVLGRFIRHSPALLGSIPKQIDFEGGFAGTQIDDWPFDGANILETDLGGPIPYSDQVVESSPALGDNGRYFTLKLPGLFLFSGEFDGPSMFSSKGFARSSSRPDPHEFDFVHAGRSWKAYAFQRRTPFSDSAVNQLFLIESPVSSRSLIPSYSTRSANAHVNFSGKSRIVFATFTVTPAGDETGEAFENLSEVILRLLSDVPSGIAARPSNGDLANDAAAAVGLEIDAFDLPPGNHSLAVDVRPADGDAETVRAPVNVIVGEPAIHFDRDSVQAGAIIGGASETVSLAVGSNTGDELAWSASLIGGGDWVSLLNTAGTTPGVINLRFTPPDSLQGIYRAAIEVRSGESTHLVPINYVVENWDPTGIFMDPLRDTAFITNHSTFGGLVVAVSQRRRTVRQVIRVGNRPSDIAFSPDGSAIYILSCCPVMEIIRIDPLTFEITGRRKVPGTVVSPDIRPQSRIAVGPDQRIYYTDSDFYPTLRMLDFESGEIPDKMTSDDIPVVGFNSNAGFCDVLLNPHDGEIYFTRRSGLDGWPYLGRISVEGDRFSFIGEHEATVAGRITGRQRLFSDLDGTRFMVERMLFERADMDNGEGIYADPVIDISAYGDLVLTRSAVLDAATGQKLADLPATAQIAAFTSNQLGVIYHAGQVDFEYWPLPAEIRPPSVAIRSDPSDGSAIELGDDTLRWSSLPLVDGYRIYLGEDAAAVAAAGPGSPLGMGLVTSNSFTMDPAPTTGTFHWRIDALRGDRVIPGNVHSFSVASFQVAPRRIDIVAPHGALPQRTTLAATDGDGNPVAWSASATAPWIDFPQASGNAGDELVVDLDPEGLSPGSHSGTIRVTGAGITLEIAVSLQLFKVDLRRLVADPNRPVVYGLQSGQQNGPGGYIVKIDAATGRYISAMPLEKFALQFAVHPIEDRSPISPGPTGSRFPRTTNSSSSGTRRKHASGPFRWPRSPRFRHRSRDPACN